MDVQVDGMVYASIQRPPVSKAKPVSINEDEIMKAKGAKRVIKFPMVWRSLATRSKRQKPVVKPWT